MRITRRLASVLFVLAAVAIIVGGGLLVMFTRSANDEYSDYHITLYFSCAEPSFVNVWVNGTNRMGGLWGIVDGVRTIDFGCAWAVRDPRLLSHSESTISCTHWRVSTTLDVGSRAVDFYADRNVLTLKSSYCLNRSAVVTDFYWEMINVNGVDPNATVVIGYADGRVQQRTWGTGDYDGVVWVWMRFREWMLPQLMRQMLFIAREPVALQLREAHGNDILFTRVHSNASFTTEIHFDVPAPAEGAGHVHRSVERTPGFSVCGLPNDERIQTAFAKSAETESADPCVLPPKFETRNPGSRFHDPATTHNT
jgi:hypothetical protein